MKKTRRKRDKDTMRPEYDFSKLLPGAVRGKYLAEYRRGTNLVLLDPDVAGAFADDAAVNEALRLALRLASVPRARRSHRASTSPRHA
ncbi:MAG: hypothetical protein HY905_11975 [Deltaproteobacteria bacterium]|nr:hypothetical protein [Deltaproteobacteria bacterium]